MSGLSPDARAALAAMPADELTELLGELRSIEDNMTPMERAAAALRRSRGLDRGARASKEDAANALRAYGQTGSGRGSVR